MKLISSIILSLTAILFVGFLSSTYASESITEMRSRTEYDYRCWAGTVLVEGQYRLNVSCRNLIYPNVNGPKTVAYVLWANPTDGSGTFRLGSLDFGTKTFRSKVPFGSLFVTTESSNSPRDPSGPIVMSGDSRPISFLDAPGSVTEIDENTLETELDFDDQELRPSEELDQATDADFEDQSSGSSTFRRTSLIASFVVLVILIAFIFIITKSRG